MVFYASSDIQLGFTERKIFPKQKMKLRTAQIITCDVQDCVQELKIPCREEGEGSAGRIKQREEQREIATEIEIEIDNP